jgi:hypothetical protein
MAVDVRTRGDGLAMGAPWPLFVTNAEPANVLRNVYSPSTDGQRFLLMSPLVPRGTVKCGVVCDRAAVVCQLPERA